VSRRASWGYCPDRLERRDYPRAAFIVFVIILIGLAGSLR
jgi:hypothetical protein